MNRLTHLAVAIVLAVPAAAVADAPRASAGSPSGVSSTKLERFVTFEPGRRRVYSSSREQLRLFAKTVRATCPAATVTVEGNAYVADDEERSIALGQGRADIVRGLLVRSGMSPQSVIAIGVARGTLEEGNGRHVDLVIDCPAGR